MPKYRKKPVTVDAEQWAGPDSEVRGVESTVGSDPLRVFWVTTAHGQRAYLEPGDWVIAEPDGRGFYPCKPDIFDATYESVGG